MSAIVYLHVNLLTGKGYVGFTKKTMEQRWKGHLGQSRFRGAQGHFLNAIRKYGSECWLHTVLEECTTDKDGFSAERHWIKELGTRETGYNMTDGGEGLLNPTAATLMKMGNAHLDHKPSEATRKRMSDLMKARNASEEWKASRKARPRKHQAPMTVEARHHISLASRARHSERAILSPQSREKARNHPYFKNRPPISEETRRRLSESHKGQRNTLESIAKVVTKTTGRKRSAEVRAKMSKAQKGRIVSVETREKLRVAMTGFRHTKEACKKISAGLRGRPVSEETRRKIGDAHRGISLPGHPQSEEAKKKISVARKNAPPPSEATREKMSQAARIRWAVGKKAFGR